MRSIFGFDARSAFFFKRDIAVKRAVGTEKAVEIILVTLAGVGLVYQRTLAAVACTGSDAFEDDSLDGIASGLLYSLGFADAVTPGAKCLRTVGIQPQALCLEPV